ncbi:MAG: CDP-alcohol phosphatidyltransferase family protein [Deltaproteobacteria bacterium]|jgi:cardiolipin synthase|nr:CDP-alcohol phosphatidyltransferase family protein [Deltaproteobacteria bacterium]
MQSSTPSDRIVTLPNALTALRLALIPVFVVCVVRGASEAALGVFTLAAITDLLDGAAARLLDQRSKLGSYLDPIADKSLAFTAFVLLAWRGVLPVWLAALVVARDAAVVAFYVTLRVRRSYHPSIRPSLLGKSATFFELVVVGVALVAALADHPAWAVALRDGLSVGAALLIVTSVGEYVHHERRVIRSLLRRS